MPTARANKDESQEENSEAATLVEQAVNLIRYDILTGVLSPDTKLGIHELAARYGIGATPIREALSRLTAQGLVKAMMQRGFRVSPISRADLIDIVATRELVELEALRRSMTKGGDAWEAGIVSALYRMEKYTQLDAADLAHRRDEFDTVHKQFHTSLIAACGSTRLLEMQSALYDQAFRYRYLMMGNLIQRPHDLGEVHGVLAHLVLSRDEEKACAELARHLHSTIDFVYPTEETTNTRTA